MKFTTDFLKRLGFNEQKIKHIQKHEAKGDVIELHSWYPGKRSYAKPEHTITIIQVIKN